MIVVQKTGRGLSGCVRYVLGEGRKPETEGERVAWIGGQGFEGWTPRDRDTAELARRVMEFAALRQTSKTRPCDKDCLHLILSWRIGETPPRNEMESAAREALKVLGMGRAQALFVAHNDTKHAHLHIVASRIDPKTGRAFRNSYSHVKLQRWAHDWERRHGGVQCPARTRRSFGRPHQVERRPRLNAARSPQDAPEREGVVSHVERATTHWRRSARAATGFLSNSRISTGGGIAKIGDRSAAWRPAASGVVQVLRVDPRDDERQPFRPVRTHKHGKGFVCNACREWHPRGMMHCELV